MAVVKGHGWW